MARLKEFYAKAGEATAFVQEDPEIFDSEYKGMQAGNGGVVGMLEVISVTFHVTTYLVMSGTHNFRCTHLPANSLHLQGAPPL